MGIYLKKFDNHTQYENYINGSDAILPNVSICTTEGDVHYNPYVDPCASEIVKTTYEWVEIGGIKWATKNVGALTETDYGQLFSWGGVNGYTLDQLSGSCHSRAFSWVDYEFGNGTSSPMATEMSKYNATDDKTVLEAVDDAATVNMGARWRMPTEAEFQSLSAATTNTWVTNYQGSGINGRLFTDNTDGSKVLFFPAAGCYQDDSASSVSIMGFYWSSSLKTNESGYGKRAMMLGVLSSYAYIPFTDRNYGCSVRSVIDE